MTRGCPVNHQNDDTSPGNLSASGLKVTTTRSRSMSDQTADSPEIAHAIKAATYWARSQGLELNPIGTGFARLGDALFIPMDAESRQEFADGAGRELRRMHSLRSSTGLAYNVFAPWKPVPTQVATLLGGEVAYTKLGFERKYPTGVSSRHPHLDVVISDDLDSESMPIAVEAKFLEIYHEPKPADFSRRYLESVELWDGLPNLRSLGERLAANPATFQRLGAAQLVKHTLGLAREYGHNGFRLVYLWYDFFGEAADTHRSEVERFVEMVATDISFTVVTYQDLYEQLTSLEEPKPGYFRYLAGRYGLR